MRATLALLRYSLVNSLRYRIDVVGSTFSPILWVLPAVLMAMWAERIGLIGDFAEVTGTYNYIAFFLIGGVYWNFVEAVWGIAFSLREQMFTGTLENLWASSIRRLGIIIAWSLASLLAATIFSIIAIAVVGVTVGLDVGGDPRWGIAISVFVLSLIASYGFAFLLFGLTLRFKDAENIVSIIANAAPLLGGVIFPVTLLPLPLRFFSYALPFTWGLDALRGVLLGAETILPSTMQVILIAVLAAFFIGFGWIAFIALERRARREGLSIF
ncbi:MAG: hypothetical protein DDT29_02268 [Dehalococcoidia bacterium]|nr:hypothetical protein [Bacillota bacterium]